MRINNLPMVMLAFSSIFFGISSAKSNFNSSANFLDLLLISSTLGGGNIQPGAGYSNDMQQIAHQACIAAKAASQSDAKSIFQLDAAKSFSELQEDLKIDVSARAGIGLFSADAEATYFKSIIDKDYSFSLNYYLYAQSQVQIALEGYGVDALNDFGKSVYDSGKNKYFGLFCGDSYINDYYQGAMLIMSLNLDFDSHYEKEQFEAHAEVSFGDILGASGEIQKISTEYNIHGDLSMQAYQKGGDPAQLAKILSKDPSGSYYALTCDLENMDDCIKAADGLLDYARDDFPEQFSFTEERGLTPLGQGFASYVPIEQLTLIPAPSLLTPEIEQDRIDLSNELEKYEYYKQKFKELLDGYPIAWNTTSEIYKNAQKLYQRAQENIDAILNPSQPDLGGKGCFTAPENCNSITTDIRSKIIPISTEDLDFLDKIKYFMPVDLWKGDTPSFYKAGDFDQWGFASSSYESSSLNLNNTNLSFYFKLIDWDCGSYWCKDGVTKDTLNYIGHLGGTYGDCYTRSEELHTFTKQLSPYYFTPWNETSSDVY